MFIDTYPADWHHSPDKRKLHVHCSVLGYLTCAEFLNVIYDFVTCVHIYGIAVHLQAHRTFAYVSSSSIRALVVAC